MVRDTRIFLVIHLLQPPICEYNRRDSNRRDSVEPLSRVNSSMSRFCYPFQQGASTFSSGILPIFGIIVYMAIFNHVLLLSVLVIIFAVFISYCGQ